MQAKDVLHFWFVETSQAQWWQKNDDFDLKINELFSHTHKKAITAELFDWRKTPQGRLAEIIVLDQFSRNMFRDKPEAFAYDNMALVLAQEAVHLKADESLKPLEKSFLYMPYMHSESQSIHEQAIQLFSQPEMEFNLEFERKHKVIIDEFGRYPHRNKILGRSSTQQEIEFLKQPNSGF